MEIITAADRRKSSRTRRRGRAGAGNTKDCMTEGSPGAGARSRAVHDGIVQVCRACRDKLRASVSGDDLTDGWIAVPPSPVGVPIVRPVSHPTIRPVRPRTDQLTYRPLTAIRQSHSAETIGPTRRRLMYNTRREAFS